MTTRKAITVDATIVAGMVNDVLAASAADVLAGMEWYAVWHQRVTSQGMAHGLTAEQSLAMFAVLSQQTRLSVNWSNFCKMLEHGPDVQIPTCLSSMREKCRAILADSTNPAQYATGGKISAFYLNLLHSGLDRGVTIDRHAIRPVFAGHNGSSITEWQRQVAIETYTRVGAALGISGAQAQAIVWVLRRGSAE